MNQKQKSGALEAAEAVMKRMLQTPPTPHAEGRGNGKRKSGRGRKRDK